MYRLPICLKRIESYFTPGFHPWQRKEIGHYATWLKSFNQSGDPIVAAAQYTAEVLTTSR